MFRKRLKIVGDLKMVYCLNVKLNINPLIHTSKGNNFNCLYQTFKLYCLSFNFKGKTPVQIKYYSH